ncbi:hypothetical protein Micbo1qcDRAFT_170348 [Microdochium bolleyi]|uniref:Uncharacterized protein n=1 Tax=Microdochium bolleyi TaxID=196109 RepID=A0A136JHB3_9PEZI|nr:hypothetical protein Micbo1qcDRAFT_170348 [Microdochium bolleyi]
MPYPVLAAPEPTWPWRLADDNSSSGDVCYQRHGSQDSASSSSSSNSTVESLSWPLSSPDIQSHLSFHHNNDSKSSDSTATTLQGGRSNSSLRQQGSTSSLAALLPPPAAAAAAAITRVKDVSSSSSDSRSQTLCLPLRASPLATSLVRYQPRRLRNKTRSRNGSVMLLVVKTSLDGREVSSAAAHTLSKHIEARPHDNHIVVHTKATSIDFDIEAQKQIVLGGREGTKSQEKPGGGGGDGGGGGGLRLKGRRELLLITIPTLVMSAGTVVIAVMNVMNFGKP